jgi:hypothetical protein
MTIKNQFKVLSLPFFLKSPFVHDEINECFRNETEIFPVFNRSGYYYDRLKKITWIEHNGWAKTYRNGKDFLYDLNIGEPQLENSVFEAMKRLIKLGYKNKELFQDYYNERARRQIRKTGRNARKVTLALLRG